MSGTDERPVSGENVASPADGDGEARIADLVAARDADNPDVLDDVPRGDVPAGGAGADSGAVGAVEVDSDSEADVEYESIHNDEPGIGSHRPRD